MQWLNYHHLYYFWTIAREGSIAKAATKLNLGQPTLSTQLKHLEDALGRPLFDRTNRRLKLTESGEVALQYANEIFRLGSEMVEAIEDRLRQDRLHVQIGALDSVPKDAILQMTQAAYAHSNCMVSILEGKGDELLRELLAHRLDILISNFAPSLGDENRVYAKTIAHVPIIVCGAPKFKSLTKKFPHSLSGQKFVLPTFHSKLRHDLDHYFEVNKIQIEPVAETQDTSLQKLLGLNGVGLIPIAQNAVEDLIAEKRLVNLGRLEAVYEDLWLVSASRKIENPVAAHLLKSFSVRP